MEQETKVGGRLSGAGNKGRGEVEWSREQREGEVERSREQREDEVEVVNLEDCHSGLGVRG